MPRDVVPHRRGLAAAVLALLLAAGTSGCGGGSTGDPGDPAPPVGQLVADFLLPDVNPASASFGADVSPRDHLGGASGWYFAHST